MRKASMAFTRSKNRENAENDLFAQSIRRILNDILLKEIRKNVEFKVIAIISPFKDDGKSEISEQLSRAFSAQGNKTLLMDLQSVMDAGICTAFPMKAGKLPEECIKTHIRNLDYLPLDEIGKSYGIVFDKASLATLLEQLKNKYRRIIIDTSSLEDDLSGYIAAGAADGVYFICNENNMRKRQPEQYYRVLKEIGVNILGIVYNNVELNTVNKLNKIFVKNSGNHG